MIHSHEAVLEVSVCFLSGSCSRENSWVFVAGQIMYFWLYCVFAIVSMKFEFARVKHEIQMKVFVCKRPCGECCSLQVFLWRFGNGMNAKLEQGIVISRD